MTRNLKPLIPLGTPREAVVLIHTKILEYYDEPLEMDSYEVVSHDVGYNVVETGQRFIYGWYDMDEEHTRCTLFRVTDETMEKFYAGKLSLRDVWLSQTSIIVRTINHSTGNSEWTEAPLSDFPEDSISDVHSFHKGDEYFPELVPMLDLDGKLTRLTHLYSTSG